MRSEIAQPCSELGLQRPEDEQVEGAGKKVGNGVSSHGVG